MSYKEMSEVKKNTLIVNYLPQSLTDEEFEAMFAEIGLIKKCKIVRDRNTGYSYGFGFVEYVSDHDALLAIEMLNGTQLQHKVIKVAYSRQGENVKGANLYISNLPKSYSVADMENVFAPYGTIVQCRILTTETGASRGIGFVLFETRDQAESAMNTLNGTIPAGSSAALKVAFAEDKNKPPAEFQQNFLSYSDALLGEFGGQRGLYSRYDEHSIPSLTSLTPQITGMRFPRGFAMIRGRGRGRGGPLRKRGALSRLRYNPLTSVGGYAPSSIPVVALPSASGEQNIIYAYNIGAKTTQEELSNLFSLYGTVSKVDVIWDYQKNMGKGYGFVTMPNYEEAERAIECLNGYNYAGKPLQVSFKTPKA